MTCSLRLYVQFADSAGIADFADFLALLPIWIVAAFLNSNICACCAGAAECADCAKCIAYF